MLGPGLSIVLLIYRDNSAITKKNALINRELASFGAYLKLLVPFELCCIVFFSLKYTTNCYFSSASIINRG